MTYEDHDDVTDARYHHDCDQCVSLGHFHEYDLYYCPQDGMPTVIARYGNAGQYRSGLVFGKSGADPILAVAYRRARDLKLVE